MSTKTKSFDQWFSEQGSDSEPDPEETFPMKCSCGKREYLPRKALENGDTGWYWEGPIEDPNYMLCGSGPFCLP